MAKIRKIIAGAGRAGPFLWLVFVSAHLLMAGKSFLGNVSGSLPPFFFGLIPLVLLGREIRRKKKRRVALGAVALAFVLGASQIDLNLPRPQPESLPTRGYTEVKIVNWNTNCWDQHKNKNRFYQFLKRQNADIYLLQEYIYGFVDWNDPKINRSQFKVDRSRLTRICSAVPGFPIHYLTVDDRKRIRAEFPGYHLVTDRQFVVISRYPILRSHADASEQYAVTDIEIGGRRVRFFNVHMLLHIEPENPFGAYFYAALHRRYVARQMAFRALERDLRHSGPDYLLAGDFNSTKAMGVMHGLLTEHLDAVSYTREWLPLTFSWMGLYFWRFDYVLLPKENENLQLESFRKLGQEGLSDHNPQYLVLRVKQGTEASAD